MKFRVLDILQCPCGRSKLMLENPEITRVDFVHELNKVRCQELCGFKQCIIREGNVTAQDCMECYAQEIMAGKIVCECGKEYEIVGGIPRFLSETMAADFDRIQKTFSYEWKMFRFGERNWGQNTMFRKNLFLQGMGVTPSDLRGKLIFDAGCGSGLLSIEMARSFRMEVMALDLAFGIEKAYEHNDNPFVHFMQGSVLEPPFRNKSFDYIYCAGVLVALPDSRTGFLSIIKTLRGGGRCFIWVYHPVNGIYHPDDKAKIMIYNWIRKYITSRLPITCQYCLYLSVMPAFIVKQKIELLAGVNKDTLSWREKMQALFDMFSPVYQNRHSHEEVITWYENEGFTNIYISDKGRYGFGVHGDLN